MPRIDVEKPEARVRLDGKKSKAESPFMLSHLRFSPDQEAILFGNLNEDSLFIIRDPRFSDVVNSMDRRELIGLLSTKKTNKDVIVENYKEYARYLASRVSGIGLSRDQKMESSIEGVNKAIDTFDPEIGYPFSKFLKFKVVNAVQRAARENLGLTEREYRDLSKSFRVKGAFVNELNREPTKEELRQQLLANTDISIRHIVKALEIIFTRRPQSLSDPLTVGSRSSLYDVTPDQSLDPGELVADNLEMEEIKNAISQALDRLSADEREVIERFLTTGGTDILSPEMHQVILKLRQDEGIQQLRTTEESVKQKEEPNIGRVQANSYTSALKERLANATFDFEKIFILAYAGYNYQDIALRVDMSLESLRILVAEANKSGFNLPEYSPSARLNLKNVKRWIEEDGLYAREIANMIGISQASVEKFVGKHRNQILTRKELAEAARSEATERVRLALEKDPPKLAGLTLRPRKKTNKESVEATSNLSEEVVIFAVE